jgi:UDP-galactopyranose mutase
MTDTSNDASRLHRGGRTRPAWPRSLTIVVFSHLRWDFAYQRPQHLSTRAARQHRVLYVEEAKRDAQSPFMEVREHASGVRIAVPHLTAASTVADLRDLLDQQLADVNSEHLVLWYYTPTALPFSEHLDACAVVYDCTHEPSALAGSSPGLAAAEARLLARTNLVLAGGHSLYVSKRRLHPNVHEVPGGVDVAHFATARRVITDPADQALIPRPRIGFFGVLDERLDRDLLAWIANEAPDWHFVLIGPVARIDPGDLPTAPNLHYLGPKAYDDLPAYIAGWDVAMMPLAMNTATRFISPTKTPEYLAAGKHVISTPIADVVRAYGDVGLVYIAETPELFLRGIDNALAHPPARRLEQVDALLATQSWDVIWARAWERLRAAIMDKRRLSRRQLTSTPAFQPALSAGQL